ncbi:DUF4388 domain-containing protein [Deinococcus aquatilis]|uniref:DUF4388 domain-containing protein n=1 Tax=Deinococcus aquatilis TaxID=519440 RepID=UPI000477B051|nr:DUF4388 domain-containing protein [Deinococcus aquatilis]
MALFGDLKDHLLTDLAKILKSQSGTLFLHQAYQHRTIELNLSRGQVLSLYLDGFPVLDQAQVREILQHLQTQREGAFEFQPRPLSVISSGFHDLTLIDLLQTSRDQAVLPSQLPHPDTRFMFSGLPVAVPAIVEEIWALLKPHLESGASSAELSVLVGRSEDEMQRMLYQLRALELVTPQRAGAPTGHRNADAPVVPSVSPPLVHRFLSALRRLTGTART